jgi:hypothetical protein
MDVNLIFIIFIIFKNNYNCFIRNQTKNKESALYAFNNTNWSYKQYNHVIQSDGFNCGVYAAKFLQNLIAQQDLENVLNEPQRYRTEIKELLASKSLEPFEFCSICCENYQQKNRLILIKCMSCTRHFHIDCHLELSHLEKNKAISCLECLKLIKKRQ